VRGAVVTGRAERPFVVPVAALRRRAGSTERVVLEGVIEELAVTGSEVPAGSVVRLDAVLEAVSGGVLVRGRVHASWRGACRRCLEPVVGELAGEVDELCLDVPDEEHYEAGREALDLEPLVHDACILALPLAPLCAPGCRGLCVWCGANLNLGPCGCGEQGPAGAG